MRIIAVLLVALIASAVTQAKDYSTAPVKRVFKEGEHYVRLSAPVRTTNPEKIEVTEVFWYGCGHCYMFEPQLQRWRKTLPDKVLFMESPAMWRKNMETHARIFYTSKALGVLDTMHLAVFEAMHIKKMKLNRPEQIQALYEQQGISSNDFNKTFNSFSVTSSVNQAKARARNYGITGTPEIVVDGTYRISSRLAGSQTNMLAVAEYLVCKIDAEKQGKGKGKGGKDSTADMNNNGQKQMSSFCVDYTK